MLILLPGLYRMDATPELLTHKLADNSDESYATMGYT